MVTCVSQVQPARQLARNTDLGCQSISITLEQLEARDAAWGRVEGGVQSAALLAVVWLGWVAPSLGCGVNADLAICHDLGRHRDRGAAFINEPAIGARSVSDHRARFTSSTHCPSYASARQKGTSVVSLSSLRRRRNSESVTMPERPLRVFSPELALVGNI